MAEIDETAQGDMGINLPETSQVQNQEVVQELPSPTPTGVAAPEVSDINFEDVAEMIGNDPGSLAKLQFVDPVFEGMLMQAAIPINAAPPITGLHNINNPHPGKSTQHYNPYENATPADVSTIEGKKKLLQQGMYKSMVNPKMPKAPGYVPDLEFGIRETNFDRYYAHDLYDQLGFHPFRNNEEIYNANATFYDEFSRSWQQTGHVFDTGFMSNWNNMADWAGFGDGTFAPDKDGAFEYADAMRIGSSSKKGLGGFTNRFVLNAGYTFGIIANIAVEEAVLALATVASGGGAAPAAGVRTAMNVGRLGKLGRGFKNFRKTFAHAMKERSRISAGAQLMNDLKKVENARHFFRAAGSGALNFIAPSTVAAIKSLNTSKGVVRGINNFKNAANFFGGFYRDVRQVSMAVAEGKLEAGMVYNNMIDGLYHDYIAHHGNTPPMEKMDEIQQKATAGAMATLQFNVPLIYLTNKIVFKSLFQGMGGLSKLTQRHQTGMGRRIFSQGSKVTGGASAKAAAKGNLAGRILYDGGASFLGRVKKLGLKGNFGAMGAMALRYTGANFAEGFQEISQEVIAKSAEDYYTGLFVDPGYSRSTMLEASIKDAINAQISPQGFEVFMSGFLMGGVVQPVQNFVVRDIPAIYQWGKGNYGSEQSRAKYQEYKKNKEDFLAKTIDNQNKLLENVFNVFDPTKLNATEQKQINERLLQSSYSSDMLSIMDDKDHSVFGQIDYLYKTGNTQQFKQVLKDWQKLTDEELIEGWPELKRDVKSGKFRERLQKFDKKVDEFQAGWDQAQEYVNPFDPTQFMKDTAEYNGEALRYIAFDHARKLFMYTQDTFKRSLERSNSIFERLGNDSAISNMKSSDISVLLELKNLKTEIENLESEIELGATTADQQELIEKKQKKLGILKKYLDVITDPANFTKNSKYNIPLEMKGDMVATEEDGPDVIEIGGQKFKAIRKILSEVGTFDRRKINKLSGPFNEYLEFLAAENGEFIHSTDLNEVLKDIVDYKFLKGRSQSYFRAIEVLSDPNTMMQSAERIAERLKVVYNRQKSDVEKTAKKYVEDLEKNELINQLASQLVYPDADQVVLFFQEGIIPTIFHMESGQVTPQSNPTKWDLIQSIIKDYQNRPGQETSVTPGDAVIEEDVTNEDEFDRLARQSEESTITDETNSVLVTKWKAYIQSKIGKSGKVLSWDEWQNSKAAKNIRSIRSQLHTIYSSDLTAEQQKEKSFDTWLAEEQRTPEVFRILNFKGGSYSDYVITDAETVNTEKLNELDELVGESLSGINILKKKVPSQSQDDPEEYYYEIVDNNMNNLYEQYSTVDPNGNVIKDVYKTEGAAIGAQQMIVGLQPSNSKFGPNNEYHFKQVLQDNNKDQFVVITTPKTWAAGGKIYLRPLEFANDRSKSFPVEDLGQYTPLDTTTFKVRSTAQNVLLLRQSEPIKLYAHRQQNETAEQAEVRLSERLRDLTPDQVEKLELRVSNNPKFDEFKTKKPDDLSPLGTESYSNPNLKVGSEELTVAVMHGREILGYLQGPTGAVIVVDGKTVNPLTLTEDNVDEFYQIYDTTRTQLRTKAEQLAIIKNNYASSILLNNRLRDLLGSDSEVKVPIGKIKGLNLRVSPGKMAYAPKGQGATFSELVSSTIDGENFWIMDNRSDGKGGIITNITEDTQYEKAEATVDAGSEQSGYNPLYTKSRYVAAVRLPNGTFTFVELKAGELSVEAKNKLVLDILNEQNTTLANNIDQENDEVKDDTATFAFNDELKNNFYIFGKTGEFVDVEVTARGDVQVIYRSTKRTIKSGEPLRVAYTINENDLKVVKEATNPFDAFLKIANNKIKVKDSYLFTPTKLVLTSDNFRKSIPKSATAQDLASAITNFQKGLREKIRVEAVITDAAQIDNIKNNSLPTYILNDVKEKIENTDQILVNADVESPALTPEYMRNLQKDKFQNVDNATIKLIARKLATNEELSPAETAIYTNTLNKQVRDDINLLKLTYKSGVIQEGGVTDVDVDTVETPVEKSESRKIADQIEELEDKAGELEDKLWEDTYYSIASDEQIKADPTAIKRGNIAANEVIENSKELKDIEAQIDELKKKLAPKVISKKLGEEHIEKIDTFISEVKRILPDFIQVQDIQDLSARLKGNGITAGMFALSLNTLGNNLEGTIYVGKETPFKYHEAGHAVFRMLLSEAEIKKYLKLAKKEKLAELKKEGETLTQALNELRSSHSIYNNLSRTELADRLYEEYIWDKFDEFKMNAKRTETSSEIKSLFTRIIEWIKAVINRYSKNELTTLFENIDAGKYSTASVQENRFTKGLERGISSAAPKVIAIDSYQSSYTDPFTGQEIVSMSNVYMSAVDQRKMIATIAALYRSYVDRGDLLIMSKRAVLDTAIRDYARVLNPKREYYTSEASGLSYRSIRKKLKAYHKALRTNSDVVAENVSNYLNIFDAKFQIEQDAFEDVYHDENTNVRKVDEYGKDASQIGGAMSLSTELRQFIATTVLEEQDMFGNKETLDGTPIVTTVDFDFAYSGLLKALSDKTNDLQMLQALATFSSTNANTAAVASNIFTRLGIKDPLSLLDEERLPQVADPNFLQKVIKGFNQFRVDYMFAHKDTDSGIVFIYDANKKDDANSQINHWANHFDTVYPTLLSDSGKKKAVSLLNLFRSQLLNPKERSRKKLIEESQKMSKKIFDQIGIHLNPSTIEYSILSGKPVKKNWEEALVSLGIAAGVEPITAEDVEEMRISISNGENIFLDNQTEIPLTKEEEQNTPEEIRSSTGISSRLKKIANTNAAFDETVGATVFRDPKGNFIYAHQMPTFHLVKVAEMNEKDWVDLKLQEDKFFNKNYLLNNNKFKAHAAAGKLKVRRFIGSKEGKLTENEHGSIVENRGLNVNQQDGVSFGESTGAEFIADVINSYVYHYNRNSEGVPLNDYKDEAGKDKKYIESPVILKVLSDASTSDFVSLPIEKMVELDDAGDIKLTDHTLNALIYNMLQTEYIRVANELDPEMAELDVIEGFNTDQIKKGKQLGQRGKRFVRSKGFITKRGSKIKVLGGIKNPMMSEATRTDIANNDQRIILRGGKAQSAIGLDSGQQTPITIEYKVEGESKYKQFALKNRGLISVSNINIDQYIKELGNTVSTKAIPGKKKQNKIKIGDVDFYFQRAEDMKFFDGKIQQYVYEFMPLEEAGIEIGVEETETAEGTEQQVEFFESDTFVEETLINAAKEGLTFDQAIEKIGEDKLKEIIEERMFTDFFDFRRLLSNTRALGKLSAEVTEGLGKIVRPEKGKRGTSYHQVTNKGREAMKLFNLKENNLDYNLAQIFMNQFINARSMNNVLLGDHAKLFENFTNETKRAKMQNNAGPSAASVLIAPELGINHTFNSDNSISLFTYHDPKASKKFSDGTFEPTDAQMVGTIKAFKHLWFGVNGLSPAMADLLSRVERGEEISPDDFWGDIRLGKEGYKKLGAIINSKKFVYGDGQVNLKMSFFPLIKQLTSWHNKKTGEWEALPQMEELHNLRVKMEEAELGKETVGLAIPVSGSKMMNKNVITAEEMYGPKSISEIQENYKDRNANDRSITQGLNPRWMRLQVINPSNKIWGIDPRQMKQLITTEQTDDVEVVINGEPMPIKKIKEAYHNSISNQVTLRYRNRRNLIFNLDTALDEVGASIDSGRVTANLSSFLRYAISGLEASQAKTQMLEFFSFDEAGNPKFDLNNPITVDKFQDLFLTYFSKGILSGNQAEITAALVSSHGVKPMRVVKKLDENNQPIETEIIRIAAWKDMKSKPEIADKFDEDSGKWVDLKVGDVILQELQHNVYDPESKTYYSEFMMAPHFKELSKFIKPGDIIPRAVAEAFGIRIPSQDKHSSISLRLVDFLPEVYGSSAMFANELVEISGADFDIDKLYMHIKEWYYKKGSFSEYGKAKTEKGRYADYIRFIISQVNKKGSSIADAITNWSTDDSAFLNEEAVENLQDELARKTASELVVNANLFKDTYTAKVVAYILEMNDEITDQQIIKLYNKNEDLYGAMKSLGLPVTLKEYNEYVEKHKVEPYEGSINNDILDQRIALVANEGIIKPKDGREVGIGNEPADLKPLEEIRDFLKETFPELADFANPEDIDPDNMLGLFETWNSIKTGEGGIGAVVRPNVVLNMLGERKITVQSQKVKGRETYPQIRFNKTTFDTFAVPYSQEGKTNDKATRTQYLISSLITMMTDNAKERLADVLSINKNSLAVVTTWASLGVPIKTSILMLKNPVIKLGYELAINKIKPTDPGITSILSKRMKFLKDNYNISTESVTDEVLINEINNDWVNPTEPLTSGFGKDMTGQTPEGYTDKAASKEHAILKQFVNARILTDYTGKLGSLTDLLSGLKIQKIDEIKQNFKDLGVGLSDVEFNKLRTRAETPLPIDVRSIFESNDFRATYYNIFKELTEDLLPVVFITRTPNFVKIKDAVVANMIQNNMFITPERLNIIEKDILSYLTISTYKQFLINSENGLEKYASLQNGLIYDELGGKNVTTISQIVNDIQNHFAKKGQKNYFIDKFVGLDLAGSDTNKSGINRLKANNWTKMSDSRAVDLQASFAEIYSEPALRTHAYDLMHYLLVKDGMQFKNNSFLNAVPAFMFDRVLTSISAGHTVLKSETSTKQSYELVFGKSSEQLANEFVHGYLLSNQNNWLLPTIKNIGTDIKNPVHINKEGDLVINLFQGIKKYINKEGKNIIKGKKYKFKVKGKSIFVNQKSKEYKALAKNAGYLSNKGFMFNSVEDGGRKYLEVIFPLYLKNTYTDMFGGTHSKTFELQQTGREQRYVKSGDIMNMLDGEELTAKGYQAMYKEVETVGSNQVTPVSFAIGEVPTYKSLREKYKSDPIDALIKGIDLDNIDDIVKDVLGNLDASNIQDLYNQAVNSGSEIKSTDKGVTINGKTINTKEELADPREDNFNYNIEDLSQEVLDNQIAGTELLLNMLSAKKEESSKSDVEIKAIRDWWNDPTTNRYEAQKYTKRSGIDGILKEFDTFDGTAERFIEIIKNCK